MLAPPRTLRKDEWPPNYPAVYAWRQERVLEFRREPTLLKGALAYYADKPQEFINHWCVTYDPRLSGNGRATTMPFILFERQDDYIEFMHAALVASVSVLCEKSRDMGVTWLCCAFSVWLWLFWPGSSVGWGSRKTDLVDKIGVPDSIFEKIRIILRNLPPEFLPAGFDPLDASYMRVVNPTTGSSISGESGDNIGRGGRKLLYFKDESAHYERPELIEASLGYNTNMQVDVSSVNGPATIFQRKREAGVVWLRGQALVEDATNVFIFDWSEHPEKTQKWYERERKKKEDEGLLHIFAQEVDRNPSAAVIGTIIPDLWVRAAVGAAERLGLDDSGGWGAALDVADGGGDRNALAVRKGIVLKSIQEWGARDTGVTTRNTVHEVLSHRPIEVQYDCIGVGSGIKAEANRLSEKVDGQAIMPKGIRFVPWDASATPEDPEGRLIADDQDSPLNKDFYQNLKAQGWWQLRLRFERTYRAVTEPTFSYDANELISLPPDLPLLQQVIKELTQPTQSKSAMSLKLVVDKTPEGMRSPNLGDAIMMCYWPVDVARPMVISKLALERSRHGLRPWVGAQQPRPANNRTDAGMSLNDY